MRNQTIEKIASDDEKTLVRAEAIKKLDALENPDYTKLFKASLASNSSAVKGSALKALYKTDKEAAMEFAASLDNDMDKESLKGALIPVYILDKTEEEIPFVADNLIEGMFFTEDKERQNTYKEGFQWVAGASRNCCVYPVHDLCVARSGTKSG